MTALNKDGTPRKPYTWKNKDQKNREPGRKAVTGHKALTAGWLKKVCPTVYKATKAGNIRSGTLRVDALKTIMARLWKLGFQNSSDLHATTGILKEAEAFLKEKA